MIQNPLGPPLFRLSHNDIGRIANQIEGKAYIRRKQKKKALILFGVFDRLLWPIKPQTPTWIDVTNSANRN